MLADIVDGGINIGHIAVLAARIVPGFDIAEILVQPRGAPIGTRHETKAIVLPVDLRHPGKGLDRIAPCCGALVGRHLAQPARLVIVGILSRCVAVYPSHDDKRHFQHRGVQFHPDPFRNRDRPQRVERRDHLPLQLQTGAEHDFVILGLTANHQSLRLRPIRAGVFDIDKEDLGGKTRSGGYFQRFDPHVAPAIDIGLKPVTQPFPNLRRRHHRPFPPRARFSSLVRGPMSFGAAPCKRISSAPAARYCINWSAQRDAVPTAAPSSIHC